MLFNFQRQGLVMIDASEGEDRAFEAAMEAGAADVQPALDDDDKVVGYKVRRMRQGAGVPGCKARGSRYVGTLGTPTTLRVCGWWVALVYSGGARLHPAAGAGSSAAGRGSSGNRQAMPLPELPPSQRLACCSALLQRLPTAASSPPRAASHCRC